MKAQRQPFWFCSECGAENHEMDADCQFCDKHACYVSGEEWHEDGPNFCSRCGHRMPEA
jgi:hypothetical protein